MKFNKTTLKNGLRVITVPMPSVESVTVQIIVGSGSRQEKKEVNGIAHFLEHMVFKGTKKYPSTQAIASVVDSVGAENNAHTGKEETAFYVKTAKRHINLSFDILASFIKEPLLRPKDIDKEKGVIIEEIAMYEDLPMHKAPDVFEELLYGGSSLGWDIAGTKESVSRAQRDDFLAFREENYNPHNMVLGIAGNFDQEEVLKLAEGYFGEVTRDSLTRDSKNKRVTTLRANKLLTVKVNPSGKPEVKLVNKKTEQAHLVLGVRGNPLGHTDRYKEAVLGTILGGGMSSRLFAEIREKRGLAYYVRTDVDHYTDNGYLATRSGVKLDKAYEAVRLILAEYRKLKVTKISQKELSKAKEYLKGRMALGLEDTHSVVDFASDQELFEGEIKTPEEVMREIDKVSIDDILAVAGQFFQNDRLNLAIVGPYEDKAKFEQLLKF